MECLLFSFFFPPLVVLYLICLIPSFSSNVVHVSRDKKKLCCLFTDQDRFCGGLAWLGFLKAKIMLGIELDPVSCRLVPRLDHHHRLCVGLAWRSQGPGHAGKLDRARGVRRRDARPESRRA